MSTIQAIESRGVWSKVVRYGLKPLAWILAVLLILWGAFWLYVVKNEDDLKKRVSNAIRQKTRGEVQIGGLSVGFIRTFPMLSLQLTDVLIKDTVATFKHKDFLRASDIYLRLSIPGLIKGQSPLGKILVRNGEINIATDSSGNTNEYIFRTKPREGREPANSLPDVELQNVSATYVDPKRRKDYAANIQSLKCSPEVINDKVSVKINVRMLAKNIAFNTLRGAYMREKMLEGKFTATYDRELKDLELPNIKLLLDNHPYYFNAKFNIDKGKGDFALTIKSNDVQFANAVSMLTPPIQKALKPYSVVEPVDVEVQLSGKTVMNYNPAVIVKMTVRNNKVTTPQGLFNDCSFDGMFTNNLVVGKERDDYNSYLQFTNFTGRWENISLRSDSIEITNLIRPFLECDVASEVDLKTLNKLADSKAFEFLKGKTSFDIDYKGLLVEGDTSASNINGFINIENASIKYNPRNVLLSDCVGKLRFVNNDLFVDKMNTNIGKTKLRMNGSAENFLALLNVSPEKLDLKWQINSPQLHLEDFKSLLAPSSKPAEKKKSEKEGTIARTSSRIDRMFSGGDMYITLDAPVMDYKTFKATDVKADVIFTPVEVRMDRVSLNHAGGSMNVRAVMRNGTPKNPVTLYVNMQRMDIPTLFTAFNNFGQDAVTYKNLKGKLSADITYSTAITNKADLVSTDSEGQINFLLEGGELNNFEPLQKISEKAFKKQDFSEIKFADLKNTLDLKGTTFIINEMDIRSTAINFKVEGVYDIKKGTDMFIRLPVRNLLKSQANTDITENGKGIRGVSLRLRAKTGDDGKLQVSWDPLRLAKRNKKDVIDSTKDAN